MLIICDFDGTITEEDVTNLLWDRYIQENWREEILPPFRSGQTSHLDIMVAGYKPISAPKEELLDYARQHTLIRDGFGRLQALCRTEGWPLVVVSGGLDFYIEEFLPAGVPFYSYTAELTDHWEVKLPPEVVLNEGQNFKVYVLEQLKQQYPGETVVFVGDGNNDFPIARQSDFVYAVKDSMLALLCEKAAIPCTEFVTFDEVVIDLLQ
jgi:2-hydroxy-3-keto-5-methylthiopentenyl-1-phosphate phosphatase